MEVVLLVFSFVLFNLFALITVLHFGRCWL